MENSSFYYSENIMQEIFSLNSDIIACGKSYSFTNEKNSLCEKGSYCINNFLFKSSSNSDYKCYINCSSELYKKNTTCPEFIQDNIDFNNISYNNSIINS